MPANDSRTQSGQSINRGDGLHDTTSEEDEVVMKKNNLNATNIIQE